LLAVVAALLSWLILSGIAGSSSSGSGAARGRSDSQKAYGTAVADSLTSFQLLAQIGGACSVEQMAEVLNG
jgi:hypothetical protein